MRKLLIFGLLLAAFGTGLQGQTPSGGYASPAPGGGGSGSPALNHFYISANCGGLGNAAGSAGQCYQVKGDWQYSGQCSWTSGNPDVSGCPSGTFAVGDVGKRGFGTSGTNFIAFQTGTCDIGCASNITIQTFVDSTHIKMSANATKNSVTASPFYWGTNPTVSLDDATLTTADTAAANACGTLEIGGKNSQGTGPLIIPNITGHFQTFNAKCQTQSATSVVSGGYRVHGQGYTQSVLLILPEMSTSSFGTVNQLYGPTPGPNVGGFQFSHIGITGGGNGNCGSGFNSKILFIMPGDDSWLEDVYFSGFCAAQTGTNTAVVGLQFGGNSSTGPLVGRSFQIDGFGYISCVVAHTEYTDFVGGWFCGDSVGLALDVQSPGGPKSGLNAFAGTAGPSTNVRSGISGTEVLGGNSQSCQIGIENGATANFYGTPVNAGNQGGSTNTFCNNGGTLRLYGVDATNTLAASTSIFNLTGASTAISEVTDSILSGGAGVGTPVAAFAGKIISHGGNQITGLASGNGAIDVGVSGATYVANPSDTLSGTVKVVSGANYILDGASAGGSCTGTVAIGTDGLYGFGNNITTTACAATAGNGIVMPRAGTVYLLTCTTTVGGNAADACTAFKNGASQTVTVVIGAATFGFDGSHTFTFAAGDRVACQYVAAAATATNPVCTLYWF